jgi:error-prone DNA polymerase
MGSFINRLKTDGWHEWLCHSYFSFLVGASSPQDLIQTSIHNGYQSLALTDVDGVYGIARAYLNLQKQRALSGEGVHNSSALKLHYGAEIHLTQDHALPIVLQNTLVLIAQSHQGYSHLCHLLSLAHHVSKSEAWLSLDQLLSEPATDVIAIQPMRGWIRQSTAQNPLESKLCALRDHFHDRLFLAVSRHLHPAEDAWITPTLKLSKRLQIPWIPTQDVFMHHASQKSMSDLLHAIRHNRTLDQVSDQLFVNSQRSLQSLAVLEKRYGSLPDCEKALEHSHRLASSIHFDLDELRYCYPQEWIPEGMTAQGYLEHLTWKYARACYGSSLSDKMLKLLTRELDLIGQLKFADYFLTVYDIVAWARSQGILCQGRGSAANSAVCFVLNITSVNPDSFDLLFERFINAERGDPPDIDVDFEHERREEVIQYIYHRFGRQRAAMVCNVICFRSRGALRAVGKALGLSETYLKQAALVLKTRAYRHNGAEDTVARVKTQMEENDGEAHTRDLWARMANQLRGFPRHLGIHSGGFLVSNLPIHWLCPQEPATFPGRTVIQWCKDDIEGLGFFKIDILALGMLTALRKCLDLIHCHEGKHLTLATLPPEDPKTYRMIQKAQTVGVFQIESRAQMSFLPRHKPQNFYDLVVEVAIIRPGPIQGGMIHPYLRRRQGLEAVTFPDPRLKPILDRTYGVPIFQEQVMRVAMAVGGFSAGEANELRKNIGSFSLKSDPSLWLEKLQQGMRKNDISEDFIEGITGQIRGFASYGFPESHAASFALLAYASSYLKCHHPAAFFCALLNSQPMGFYSPDILIKTAQAEGVPVLPICALHSNWDPLLEQTPSGLAIRLGFRLIRALSEPGAQRWVQHRNQSRNPLPELLLSLKHSGLNRTDVTALAAANAFHAWGLDRRAALWLAEACPHLGPWEAPEPDVLFPELSELQQVQLDYHATGTSLGKHPAELMKQHAWLFEVPLTQLVLARDFPKHKTGTSLTVFGMITCRQAPPTAKGMMFITLWDESGSINLVIQPGVYDAFQPWIDGQAFLCVQGKLQKQGDALSILVKGVLTPIPKVKIDFGAPQRLSCQKVHPDLVRA